MLTHITGAKCIGIDAVRVTVEVEISNGIGIHLVGLADVAVKESLLRTMSALSALGFKIPGKKIVINLAPADLHKNGSGYDLPIAVGIIAASDQASLPGIDRFVLMGELGLDGSIRSISGALPFAELAAQEGMQGIILPLDSAREAAEFRNCDVYGVESLNDVIRILTLNDDCADLLIWNRPLAETNGLKGPEIMDFADIIGQEGAKRGVEIACAGHHNCIFVGSPGSGKSSLAKAMAGILPPMTIEESLVTSKIYSSAGKGDLRCGLIRTRPFRAPHYSASLASIIGGGGGDSVCPGEVSLAHNGILFLDEFALLPRQIIEALRGPLEDRYVVISRLRSKIRYPASFMLVAASNPCPCGYWGEGDRCTCTPSQRLNYMSKLSGPITDRIDLQILMPAVKTSEIVSGAKAEPSAAVAARVLKARKLQEERFRGEQISANAEMSNRMIEKYCPLDERCTQTLTKLMGRLNLSMRAYFRIIKVARTIADLALEENIRPEHLIEASSFRFLDRTNP